MNSDCKFRFFFKYENASDIICPILCYMSSFIA